MLRKPRKIFKSISLFLATVVASMLVPTQVMAAKINLSHPTIELTEGQSQTVTITLDEPIICPDMDETCNVQVSVSSNDEDRVSILNSPVIFPYTDWSHSYTFTITAIDDEIDNGDTTPIITLTTLSNSEYYSNFSPSLSLHILDNDETSVADVATEDTSTKETTINDAETLANTGENATFLTLASLLLITSSSFFSIRLRQ